MCMSPRRVLGQRSILHHARLVSAIMFCLVGVCTPYLQLRHWGLSQQFYNEQRVFLYSVHYVTSFCVFRLLYL